MSKSKHTGNDWQYLNHGYDAQHGGLSGVITETGVEIAALEPDATDADGFLIAAAPDLLAACETVIAHHTPELSGLAGFAEMVAAIAKARGGK